MQSTSANPLAFFDEYLDKQLDFEYSTFIELRDHLPYMPGCTPYLVRGQNGLSYFESKDEEEETYNYTFHDFIKKTLSGQITQSCLLIEQELSNRTLARKITFLDFVNSKITQLKEHPNFMKFELDGLFKRVINLIDHHQGYLDGVESAELNHCSLCPKLNVSVLKTVYENSEELDLFAENQTLDAFLDAIGNLPNSMAKIQFQQTNGVIAYYIKHLEGLCERINFSSVGTSRRFFNKKGKCLTQNDLSKALSIQRKKRFQILDDIDSVFEGLGAEW